MYINKLDELKTEFSDYEYDEKEELSEDIEKIIQILSILRKKVICIEIANFDEEF
jgi:hypothetical protein